MGPRSQGTDAGGGHLLRNLQVDSLRGHEMKGTKEDYNILYYTLILKLIEFCSLHNVCCIVSGNHPRAFFFFYCFCYLAAASLAAYIAIIHITTAIAIAICCYWYCITRHVTVGKNFWHRRQSSAMEFLGTFSMSSPHPLHSTVMVVDSPCKGPGS